jgi:hypothetical protein
MVCREPYLDAPTTTGSGRNDGKLNIILRHRVQARKAGPQGAGRRNREALSRRQPTRGKCNAVARTCRSAPGEFLDLASLSFERTIDASVRRNCALSHSNVIASNRTALLREDCPNTASPLKARANRELDAFVFHPALLPHGVAPRRFYRILIRTLFPAMTTFLQKPRTSARG